ncbi:MAG: hypothetical protein CW716_10245 [Candidatus Bathyarchaeum sp.]|nr:MAG: hypothetical protein CW716_10245 [Candidatus Bathyarchaeum sp.]
MVFTVKKKNQLKIGAIIAIIFLTIGFGIWFYTTVVINIHSQELNSPDVTEEEMWRHEGALLWWEEQGATTFFPLSTTLIAIGLITLVVTLVYTQIRRKYK